jgi:hypothetical protein
MPKISSTPVSSWATPSSASSADTATKETAGSRLPAVSHRRCVTPRLGRDNSDSNCTGVDAQIAPVDIDDFRLREAAAAAGDRLPTVVLRRAAPVLTYFRIVGHTAATRFRKADIAGRAAIRAQAAIEFELLACSIVAGHFVAGNRRAITVSATRAGRMAPAIGAKTIAIRAAEFFQVTDTGAAGAIATIGSGGATRRTARCA